MSDTQEHHHHHHHHHHHKKKKLSSEDKFRIRKLTWRKIKKIIARTLFVVMCVAAICVIIYGLYLWVFVKPEEIKEITPPT